MLRLIKFTAKKYDADGKKINAAPREGICFYLGPGLLHFTAPVNIVEHQDTFVVRIGKNAVEIMQGRLVPVIAINKSQVYPTQLLQSPWQRIIKIAGNLLNAFQAQLPEILARHIGNGGCAFKRQQPRRRVSQLEIGAANPQGCSQLQHRLWLVVPCHTKQQLRKFSRLGRIPGYGSHCTLPSAAFTRTGTQVQYVDGFLIASKLRPKGFQFCVLRVLLPVLQQFPDKGIHKG